jgi:hypothetical protein
MRIKVEGNDKWLTLIQNADRNKMSENIEIQLEPFDILESNKMTLILGLRCIDGVAIITNRKFAPTGTIGIWYQYGNKITGELRGILKAFSGDAGAFQVFASSLKDYVKTTREEKIKYILNNPLIGHNIDPSFEQVKLKVSLFIGHNTSKQIHSDVHVLP